MNTFFAGTARNEMFFWIKPQQALQLNDRLVYRWHFQVVDNVVWLHKVIETYVA